MFFLHDTELILSVVGSSGFRECAEMSCCYGTSTICSFLSAYMQGPYSRVGLSGIQGELILKGGLLGLGGGGGVVLSSYMQDP